MNPPNSYLTKTEIAKQLGYFPAFLLPAVNSSLIFRSLVQQTLSAYINNPLPNLFKEKLFVCLSRHFGISYFTICHSCTLQSLGMSAAEILNLAKITSPCTEEDITADLNLLRRQWGDGKRWCDNVQLETGLLRCAYLIFLHPSKAANCIKTLQQLLGIASYNYLIIFLGYIKLCHQWVASNPEISHQQDSRSQLHLGSLLLSESRLADFFQSNIQLESQPNELFTKAIAPKAEYLFSPSSKDSELLSLTSSWQLKQEKLISCLANMPFPVMIHGQDGKILYLNHNWIETTGYSTDDISTLSQWHSKAQVIQHKIEHDSGKTFQAIEDKITGQDECKINKNSNTSADLSSQMGIQTQNMLGEIACSLSNLAEEIAQIELEYQISQAVKREVTIITREGEQRFWEYYVAPLKFGREQENFVISVVKDITEIVDYQTQLSKLKIEMDLVQETTNTGSWSWDLINNKIDICPRGRSILRLGNFDGSYKAFLQSIHPEARESIDLSFIKAIKTRRNINLKYPLARKNYAISWIRQKCKLVYNSTREVTKLSGIVMDVTQQKPKPSSVAIPLKQSKKSKVAQSFSELANIINLLPSYIFVSDIQDKTISLINLKLSQSMSMSNHEFAPGTAISQCFSSDYARQIIWQQQQVLTYGKELNVQEEVTLSDGIHYFDTTITPLRNDSDEIYALLHTSNDIPDLAATKKALSQRTLQLEAANKELESFSYSVSHDLQAPLRVINGFSQVLWDNYLEDLDDRGKHYLQRIQANSDRMSDLIDALLQLSRVTRSQMKLVKVNLSKMAQDIVKELQARDPQRQVKFVLKENLIVRGDPQLLRIVLSNLLNNAWKYTSKRSLGEIEFNVLFSENNQPTFFVRDNGAGFDLEYADKLFTAFKRLHTQEEFPGTGIGLATVQRIIYRHGGKVWADGKLDRGATIYFSLEAFSLDQP